MKRKVGHLQLSNLGIFQSSIDIDSAVFKEDGRFGGWTISLLVPEVVLHNW